MKLASAATAVKQVLQKPEPIDIMKALAVAWNPKKPPTLKICKDGGGRNHIRIEDPGSVEHAQTVGYFHLIAFPHCCGMVILSNVLASKYNRGIGTLLHRMAELVASAAGYSSMVCTDKIHNDTEIRVLKKLGYEKTFEFVNRRTSNVVGSFWKSIPMRTSVDNPMIDNHVLGVPYSIPQTGQVNFTIGTAGV